jgi:ABC-type cobalamin/Fe3+-siderophores transport system ATPase subunit
MSTVIEWQEVCVRRQGRDVLRDLSFTIEAGDFLALVGANGSGKTTLLRTIMGFLPIRSGSFALFGRTGGEARSLRKEIGCVPQALRTDFRMPVSVREVVRMGRLAWTGPGRRFSKEDSEAAEQAMRDVGILALADRPIGHLSGGELQKAHIARALCQAPRLLLLDEPTSNLDLGAQRECLQLIGALHRQRALTTIVVMHDLKSLPRSCTRALILDDGKLAFDGSFAGLFSEENLAHIYKGLKPVLRAELARELSFGGTGDA